MATTKAMKLCRPSPLGPRKRAPATEIAIAQSCGVRFEAAFQIPPRVTEIPVVAAAAAETRGAVDLASTSRAERPHDLVGARVEPGAEWMALDSKTTLPPPARAPQTRANVPRIRSTTRPRAMAIFTELPHSHSQHLSDSRATVCRGYADEPERGARPLGRQRRRQLLYRVAVVAGPLSRSWRAGSRPRSAATPGSCAACRGQRRCHRRLSTMLSR